MFLAPDGDEIEIADAAAGFLKDVMPIARLHGDGGADMGEPMRRALADMGWFALALPEAQGGTGLSAVEYALFFREVGRQSGPVDMLSLSLAAMATADETIRAELLAGEHGVALAVADGDRLRVFGSGGSRLALQVTRDSATLMSLDGVTASERPMLDPSTSMRMLNGQPLIIEEATGTHVWRMGELGTAAMLIGVAEAALDLINDYAKIRETFGRKIGSYQAVRHPIANMALAAETARCQLWYAAAALKEGRGDAGMHLDAAKHLANQAAVANADTCMQLHGGIGVTDEHDAHLLLKHALLLNKLFGTKRDLLTRLLDAKLEA